MSTLFVQPSQQVTHFGMDSLHFLALTEASLELWHPQGHKFPGQCNSKLSPTATPQNTFMDSPSDAPLLPYGTLWILVEFDAKRGCLQVGASHLSEQHHRSSLQWIPLVLDSVITGSSFQLRIFRDSMVLWWQVPAVLAIGWKAAVPGFGKCHRHSWQRLSARTVS